jgi:hypothetical protein
MRFANKRLAIRLATYYPIASLVKEIKISLKKLFYFYYAQL